MKAIVYNTQHELGLVNVDKPHLDSVGHDVLIQMQACGLCGTDLRKILSKNSAKNLILGHEVAGEIIDLGKNVKQFSVGDRVVVAHHTPCYVCTYCKHGSYSMCKTFKTSNLDPGGFCEFVRIPKDHVNMTTFKIPENMTHDTAVFMEPLACIWRAVKKANIVPGDTVLVVGLGSIGLLAGQLFQYKQCKVLAVDLQEPRRNLGKKLGFEVTHNASFDQLKKMIQDQTLGLGVDLVMLTSGNANLYSNVVQLLRDGGQINIFAGLEPGTQVSYDINEVYEREITIYSSYSSSPTELAEALEFLKQGLVNVSILTPTIYNLSNFSLAVEEVLNQKTLKAIIHP